MSPTRVFVLSALVFGLVAVPALADEPSELMTQLSDDGLDLIAADLAAGQITEAEATLQRFYRFLRPDDGAPRYQLGQMTGDPICGTPLMNALRQHWPEYSPRQRHQIAETTDPTYTAWLTEGGISWLDGDVHQAQASQRSVCFSPESLRGFDSYQNQTRSEDDWFEIHWNEGGSITEQRIGWMAEWFDTAFDVEVNDLGFFAPWNITSNQLLVIVERLGTGLYGYTSLAQCGVSGYMPFIVMNAQYVDDNVSLRPTAAHEFFHAIQQVYGFEEFFIGDTERNRWWLEASAVYAATVANPFDTNRHVLHSVRWNTETYKSMTVHDDAGHQYGMVVWALSLANTLGDPVWHRDFWESLRDRSGFVLRDEFDDFLGERGSSFDEEYRKFMRDASMGDQSEFAVGLIEAEDWFQSSPFAGSHDEGDYPVDETIDGDARAERPHYLGQNYVFFDSDGVSRDKAAIFEFWGDGEKNDRAVEWFVELIAIDDDEVVETHSLMLAPGEENSEGIVGSWSGAIQLNDFRSSYDGLLMGVSPVTDFGEGGATWSYTATLVDSDLEAGFTDAPVEDPAGDDDDLGDGCADCAASAAPPANPSPALALIFAAAAIRRRTRRSAI
jgi:MYXO-CTERM domain-containing protein